MNILSCAILEYIRKPTKYILLGIIFFAVFTGGWIGIQLLDSAETAQDDVMNKIGAYLQLDKKDEFSENEKFKGEIDENIISSILDMQYVKGVNQEIADYAFPLNFKNVKEHTGEAPVHVENDDLSEEMTADSITVFANLDCSLIDTFRLGEAELVEGDYASEKCTGVMIEEKMAKENALKIGSHLAVGTSSVEKTDVEVVGIYRYKGYFEITKDNSIGDNVYALSPYNRIYSSLDIGEKLFRKKREELPLNIYISEPQYNDKVGEKIKKLKFDWEHYGLYNMTASLYKIEGQQISILLNYAKMILFYVLAIGLILVSLVLNLYAKYSMHNRRIFYALGAPKKRIMTQDFLTLFIIAGLSSAIALPVATVISSKVCENLILQTTIFQGTAQMLDGFNGETEVKLQVFSSRQSGLYLLIVLGVILLSYLPSVAKLKSKNLRQVLLKQEEA